MSKPMLWVARKDKIGWNSNRTRDAVDLAFTVEREHGSMYAVVNVRQPHVDDTNARARRIVGKMYFINHQQAKLAIEKLISEANLLTFTDMREARKWFLTKLMSMSMPMHEPGGTMPPWIIVDGRVNYLTPSTTPNPAETESLVEATEAMSEDFTSISDMVYTLASKMTDFMTEPVVEPKPSHIEPETIMLGGKQVKLEWPK